MVRKTSVAGSVARRKQNVRGICALPEVSKKIEARGQQGLRAYRFWKVCFPISVLLEICYRQKTSIYS